MQNKQQTRWQLAQNYEYNWWKNYYGDLEWYRTFSQEVESYIKSYLIINEDTKILEIGSGPAGALTFLNSNNKYAIDPLEDYFSSQKQYIEFRDPRVNYKKGKGEKLPYEENFFDLVILDNVLDHCENPQKVFDEVNRILKIGGFIFLRQNVYLWWGKQLRKIMEIIKIDKGHPFTFGSSELQRFFKNRLWEIKHKEGYGYFKTWLYGLKDVTAKGLIKSCLFITRSRTIFILKKV